MTARERRLRRLAFTPEFFVDLCKHGGEAVDVVQHRLPSDAQIVRCAYDLERDLVWVAIRSETFAVIPDGDIIPEHPQVLFQKRVQPPDDGSHWIDRFFIWLREKSER